MKLQQLRYLIAVVDHGSFNKASQALYVTQPTMSKAVDDLEREMGVTILAPQRMAVVSGKSTSQRPVRAATATMAHTRSPAKVMGSHRLLSDTYFPFPTRLRCRLPQPQHHTRRCRRAGA